MSAPTHLQLARLCQAIYGPSLLEHQQIDGVVFAVIGDTIVFRGSANEQDWIRDFQALPVYVAGLGKVESGFFTGIPAVFSWVKANIKRPLRITGHSLGGAHAVLLTALMVLNNMAVLELVTFGCPRPGYAALRQLLADFKVPMTAYRNGADMVPRVPVAFMWWSYRSYTDWMPIGSGDDPVGDHMIAKYDASLEAIDKQA